MAEEGTLGQARASHDDQSEPSKEELQRRMEEARESITQTVTEIKETVTNQYYSVKESVSEALDWRHYFRKNPVAFSIGALSVGFLAGYGIAGALKGSGGNGGGYPSAEESDAYARTGARPIKLEDDDELARRTAFHGHSYAAQAIIDSPSYASAPEAEGGGAPSASESQSASAWTPPRTDSESHGATSEQGEQEDDKPSLFERFKETSAYDRLQKEVSSLGDRFIEELSSTAHNVVLPALFGKIKELFGVDLSNKQAQGQGSQQGRSSQQQGTQQAQQAGGAATGGSQRANTQSAGASASSGAGSQGGSSYGTSENRGYGSQSQQGATASGSSHDSVLDLDR